MTHIAGPSASRHVQRQAKFPALHLGDDGLEGILNQHSHAAKLHDH